ncbi:NAD(P)H-binding protein [Streptomyces canus]|uniref:NAD(P)H-binding protein n=1 Tax=Streptomyces canus TaxID=58343 RepID=UPI0033F05E38
MHVRCLVDAPDRLANLLFRILERVLKSFEDHTVVDKVIRVSSGIDWALARAVALTDKPAVGPVRAAEAGTGKPGARINRADLAQFLVPRIEDDAWIRKAPLVWTTRG